MTAADVVVVSFTISMNESSNLLPAGTCFFFSTQKDQLPPSAKGSLGKGLGTEALHLVFETCSKEDIAESSALFLCLCPATTLTVVLFVGTLWCLGVPNVFFQESPGAETPE